MQVIDVTGGLEKCVVTLSVMSTFPNRSNASRTCAGFLDPAVVFKVIIVYCKNACSPLVMTKTNVETLITSLNQSIEQAHIDEQQAHTMADYIQSHMNSLHDSITITSKKPEQSLMRFIFDYINSTPQHLQALYALGSEAGIDEYTEPFLNLACTYMLTPPEILSSLKGLHSMLCRTYLAHRLMEEVNDQIMNLSGAALAPMDMSMANIISHSIIGDELANQLDHLVLLSVETASVDHTIFEKRSVSQFFSKRKLKNWQAVLKRWPCFTKDFAIDLQIGP